MIQMFKVNAVRRGPCTAAPVLTLMHMVRTWGREAPSVSPHLGISGQVPVGFCLLVLQLCEPEVALM